MSVMPVHRLTVVMSVVVSLTAAGTLRADIFLLRNGAEISGQWTNADQKDTRIYEVQTQSGIRVRVSRSQVAKHIREPDAILEYHRIAPTFADSVSDQWKLAEWCRERELKSQRREHLRRVVELDPDHRHAWRALGYVELDGKWVTQKDFLEERGYVYYRGKWRMQQEVDLLEERRRIARLEREWFIQLRLLHSQLGTHGEAEAAQRIAQIDDPLAVPAIAAHLRRETSPRVRLLYVQALSQIQDRRALELLLALALNDPDVEIFHAVVDKFVALQSPNVVKAIAASLKDQNSIRINRAALALGRLGDRSAIPALISALVTTHYVPPRGAGRTSMTLLKSTDSPDAAQAASTAGQSGPVDLAGLNTGPPQPIVYHVPNQEVLRALVQLSGGQSFGFDQRAWVNWWTLSNRAAKVVSPLR